MNFGSGVIFSPELAVVEELATVSPAGVSPFKFLFLGPGVAGGGVSAFTVWSSAFRLCAAAKASFTTSKGQRPGKQRWDVGLWIHTLNL